MDIILKHFPNISEKQRIDFSRYTQLFKFWNKKINLVSRKDIDNFHEKHILHSLSIAKFIKFKKNTVVVDFGTGGGLPGIPLAIFFPDVKFMLVDSIKKKITAVNNMVDELSLSNIKTFDDRLENLNFEYDFLVTRAVAKIPKIIKFSSKCYKKKSFNSMKNGIIALKGGDITNELNITNHHTITPLTDLLNEKQFDKKKIVYVSMT